MMAKGADLNMPNANDKTPFTQALELDNPLTMARQLVELGANSDVPIKRVCTTAIQVATKPATCNLEEVKEMLDILNVQAVNSETRETSVLTIMSLFFRYY